MTESSPLGVAWRSCGAGRVWASAGAGARTADAVRVVGGGNAGAESRAGRAAIGSAVRGFGAGTTEGRERRREPTERPHGADRGAGRLQLSDHISTMVSPDKVSARSTLLMVSTTGLLSGLLSTVTSNSVMVLSSCAFLTCFNILP